MNIRLIIAIATFVVTIGLFTLAYKWRMDDIAHWKKVGRNELTAEIALATQKAEEETKIEQKEIRQQSAKVKDEIKRNTNGNRPVSDPIRSQLERMRSR